MTAKFGGDAALEEQPIERGKELSFGKIAAGPEDHDGAGRHAPAEAQRVLKRIGDGFRCCLNKDAHDLI